MRASSTIHLANRWAGGLVEMIRRTDGRLVDASGGDGQFTTAGLLLLEQTTINVAIRRRQDQGAIVDHDVVERVLRRRATLGDDQAAMVTRLSQDDDGVAVVVGDPHQLPEVDAGGLF